MKNQKLPNIKITGKAQQLLEIEPILIYLGYEDDKEWNDEMFEVNKKTISSIHCYPMQNIYIYSYFSNKTASIHAKKFRASQIEKIIEYVENYKNKK